MAINRKKAIISLTIFSILFVGYFFFVRPAMRYVVAKKTIRAILAEGNLEDKQCIKRMENNKNYLIPVLINLLKDKNMQVQLRAINFLGFVGGKKAVDPLAKLLNSQEWQIRFFSAESLGLICDKNAAAPLMNRWIIEKDWRVLREITIAISKLNNKDVVSILDKYIDSEDNKKKLFCLALLYKFTIKDVYLEKLRKVLDGAFDEDKIIAIWTIGKMQERHFIPIIEKYTSSKNKKLSNFAKKAMIDLK